MASWLRQWLLPPEFEDVDKTRRAALLHVILIFMYPGIIANSIVVVLTLEDGVALYLVMNVVIFGMTLAVSVMLRQGHVGAAVWLTCIGLWLAMTLGTLPFTGIKDPYISGYIIIIVMAGMLIGGVQAIIVTIITIFAGILWILLQPELNVEFVQIWLANSFVFAATAGLMWLAQRGIQRAINQVQESESLVQQQNDELEKQIAERVRAETELRNSEAQYRQLLKVSPVSMVIVDAHSKFVFVNPAATQLLGAKADSDLIGVSSAEILPDLATILTGQHDPAETYRDLTVSRSIRNLQARLVEVEIRTVPIIFQHTPALLAVFHDLTRQKQLERERLAAEKLRVQIEEERRIVQLKETFIAMASHEFRTPLSVIRTSSNLLQYYPKKLSEEKRQAQLEKINSQISRMTHMLEDLLVLSKVSAGMMEVTLSPVSLSDLWHKVVDEIEQLDICQHEIVRDFHEEAARYPFDESLLHHVLTNLLTNAVKYSPTGSTVYCKLRYENDYAVIQVRDSGIGIPLADQKKLFQPFQRASNTGQVSGTGLGLSIVKNCVDAHDGTIDLKSITGEGTTFTIRLPLKLEMATRL